MECWEILLECYENIHKHLHVLENTVDEFYWAKSVFADTFCPDKAGDPNRQASMISQTFNGYIATSATQQVYIMMLNLDRNERSYIRQSSLLIVSVGSVEDKFTTGIKRNIKLVVETLLNKIVLEKLH